MQDSHFDQLVRAAAAQDEPHRLLFVFATSELPDEATAAELASFRAGRGGALSPVICVDKAPGELAGFEALRQESRRAGPDWQVMFAAALPGHDARPPEQGEIEAALEMMVQAVRGGAVGRFAAYDASGEPLRIR